MSAPSPLQALLRRIRHAPRVLVIWSDAWTDVSEAPVEDHRHSPWTYAAEGFLLRSDATGVSLAQEIGEDGQFRGRTFIPRPIVIHEIPLPALRIPRRKPRPTDPPSPSESP